MNTFDTDTELLELGSIEPKPMSTLACVGTVTEVEDGHESKSGNYLVQPVSITAEEAGRDTKAFITYRPEWLSPSFRPRSLEGISGANKGPHWVYGNFIRSDEKASFLRGLAGSDTNFAILMDKLARVPNNPATGVPDIEDVSAALRDFFEANVGPDGKPMLVGYELVQQMVKTDEVDEKTGKPIYKRTKNYSIKSFFDVTTKKLASLESRAAKGETFEDNYTPKFVLTYSGTGYAKV